MSNKDKPRNRVTESANSSEVRSANIGKVAGDPLSSEGVKPTQAKPSERPAPSKRPKE